MEKIKLDAITNSIKNIIIAEVGASQQPVPAEFIQQSIDKVIESFGYSIEVDDLEHIRFRLETTFNVNFFIWPYSMHVLISLKINNKYFNATHFKFEKHQ